MRSKQPPQLIKRDKDTHVIHTMDLSLDEISPCLKSEENSYVQRRFRRKWKRQKKFAKGLGRQLLGFPMDLVIIITNYWLDNMQTFEWIVPENGSLLWCFDCMQSSIEDNGTQGWGTIYPIMEWKISDSRPEWWIEVEQRDNLYSRGIGKWGRIEHDQIKGFKQIESILVWGDLILGIFFADKIEPRPVFRKVPTSYLALSHLCTEVTNHFIKEINDDEYTFTFPSLVESLPVEFRISCDCHEKRFSLPTNKEELAGFFQDSFF